MGWSFSGGGGAVAAGLTSVTRTATTSDDTQTSLGVALVPSSDTTILANLRMISRRDNGDFAVFQWLGSALNEIGGVVTVANITASTAPDSSLNTGSTLRLAIVQSGGMLVKITANASEDWSHSLVIEYLELTYS